VEKEWVSQLDDAIWRRTKLGMWLDKAQQQRVAEWLETHKQQKKHLSLAS
jgi:glycerol-3-phosphate dehydrogenase